MKALFLPAVAAATLLLALPGESLAQRAVGMRYDPHTIWTVSGEAISVAEVPHGAHGNYDVRVLLRTPRGDLSVHLGPSWFVDRQPTTVAPHDVIRVTGSPIIYHGKPALIAAEVQDHGEILRLRAADGLPLWHRSGAR